MHEWQALVLLLVVTFAHGQILTPPYFNLAHNRNITASATCGVDTPEPELYCKLVGANADQDENINVIQGQVCDYCDDSDPMKRHPPEHAVDGTETWWQSPPLSRGMKYNEVNLTIDLGQEFHVAYIYVRMGNSPRPGLWVLEKSKDFGKTWSPWQYFSDSADDCLTYFGVDSHNPISRDDSVICTTEYSKIVPLEGGEMPISILNNRPSANHYFNSTLLQEWTRATNVRFRFLRTKNLLGHLMSVARQDPTVTRRYFYSIKDISIGGRCMCNGHADICDPPDPRNQNKQLCRCQHNTCGPQCATCCKGFEQKKWRQSTAFKKFTCEPCNCFGHTDECKYDPKIDEDHLSLDIHGNYEGGGVCQNCRHNTEGINCHRCQPTFFRPYSKPLNATDVCQPCDCDLSYSTGNCAEGTGKCECRPEYKSPDCTECSYGYFGYPNCRPCECHLKGTDGYHCEATDGNCPCKSNYAGHYCNLCTEGYYNFPDCLSCECNSIGSLSNVCDANSGNCTCRNNYGGRTCDICEDGYFNYPECSYCSCDLRGTENSICDKTNGRCLCRQGYGGARCDQCISGYFGYPNCQPCNCSSTGSSSISCDAKGKCSCVINFAGRTCNQCSPGYYKYPECLSCNCDKHGAIGVSCDGDGKCQCQDNFDGLRCDQCKENFYNFPICEGCNCDPAGILETFQGCGSLPAGELCQCKERVEGRICNQCKSLFWNLQAGNPQGCEECRCNLPGVVGGIAVCDTKNGQCICKPKVMNRDCGQCRNGTYNLQENNMFGCSECACDIGGSISSICDKNTGQCPCQSRVTGRKCNEPLKTHYFPTLHQYQYEVEDGRTPSNSPVRYGFAEDLFPDYNWKGYAVFSPLQDEIIKEVYIFKPSLYRMVLRYVNPNPESILGIITIIPDNPSDAEQQFKVLFKPTTKPSFVTVAGPAGTIPSPLVMNPGRWDINIKNKKSLFLDYFVLVPSAYYEATILTQEVNIPCEIGYKGLCRHFGYPSLTEFDTVHGEGGFVDNGNDRMPLTEFLADPEMTDESGQGRIPLINDNQSEIHFNLRTSKPGLYVLVVVYVTPRSDDSTATIVVEANTSDKGKAIIYPCRYSSLCRQVVTDKQGKVATLRFPTNYVSLVLVGEPYTNVAIKSIVAIPYDEWSLDYIQPKSVCVRKNGKCVQGIFPGADAKKIEFEAEQDVQKDTTRMPAGIFWNSTKLVYLAQNDATIDVRGKVPKPGEYVFVVHYFQPDHPDFELEVLVQNGKFKEAKLSVPHCPSNSGCRSIVREANGDTRFQLVENFVITFTESTGNGIWLDYILVIPAEQYDEQVLKKIQFDQTKEFIKKCGYNHFAINSTDTFCRESVFSLTTDYNNGVLPCSCDIDGTISFECEKFGGQCPCRPNVIGRRCEICKTGFYGFPDCKPCNCPSTANCEPETGECICPPNVYGERCDICKPETYGFDPIIGCEECSCSRLGVAGHDYQCNLFDGSCNCKENVIGRQCDKCEPGFYEFPNCVICDCDVRGTTEEICDQVTAECFCKSNVQGGGCDVCKESTFNIQAHNPEGCTKCFCFDRTTHCDSANLYKTYITDMRDWEGALFNEKTGHTQILQGFAVAYNNSLISMSLTLNETYEQIAYFSAPAAYLGKMLTSYGGYLTYTIHYTTGPFGEAVRGPDVILYGADIYLMHYADEQPPSAVNFEASVEIVENNFITLNGWAATREQIMIVLENLRGIYIRGKYWQPSIAVLLSDVYLDVATDTYVPNSMLASSVERCKCPPSYAGLSCEECAPGYYRASTGTYGGYCVPCECNGHADTCDVETGICFDCQHSTRGEHCEFCEMGYHGDATIGTPMDCLICACPLPVASNNFATGCEVNEAGDKISCECLPEYYGARCQSCAAGYYGDPQKYGDYCKPCECSGNIDTNDTSSCDSVTGECLHCLHNTYGEACNLCAPGFYGDAIREKNCQSCLCDKCGMTRCNSHNGICECHRNVIGEKCDRCAVNHYGFQTCQGCEPCECAMASYSSQCDDATGQCRCKPGVSGQKCERCTPGYWNYGPEGCTSCGCNTEYSIGASCNAETGQCTCLTGVIGDKCDRCPYRWVLIEEKGCAKCDSCTHDLLDVTDELAELLHPHLLEFETVAEGHFTNQRLIFINNTIDRLEPEVKLLDPSQVNFSPLKQKMLSLEHEVQNQTRKVEYAAGNSLKWKNKSETTAADMKLLQDDVIKEIDLVNLIVEEVKALALNIEQGTRPKVESALKEAKAILKKIQQPTFTNSRDNAVDQLNKANLLLGEMEQYNVPVTNLSSVVSGLTNRVEQFTSKIDDLVNITKTTGENAATAEELNIANRLAQETGNFDTVKNSTNEAQDDLRIGEALNVNASELLNNANNFMDVIAEDIGASARTRLNQTINTNDQELENVKQLVDEAKTHAEHLHQHSLDVDALLTEARNTSAVRAVSAYKNIVETIIAAFEAARNALTAANNATELSYGIGEKTLLSEERSLELLDFAKNALAQTDGSLKQELSDAKDNVDQVFDANDRNTAKLDRIKKVLDGIPQQSSSPLAIQSMKEADNVQEITDRAISNMNESINQLPKDLEKAKTLAKNVADSIHDISQANKHLKTTNDILPNITSLLANLGNQQASISSIGNSLREKIENLKGKIANARELASRFKTGLAFYRNTTLELKNPEGLPLLATSTEISAYFRTNQTNGFLLYLGNEQNAKQSRSKTNDFMALLIENGYPVLTVDLGSGPERINSNKYVADNVWRQVIVQRTGKNIKLIIREDLGEGKYEQFPKEAVIPGSNSIFNLDQEQSKLFVGGYPMSFQMPQAVTSASFEGEMEELVIGDIPVSFWNFVDGENNKQWAFERDKLINLQPSTGLRFDGNGFAIVSLNNSKIAVKPLQLSVKFNFKTYAENGLMYLMSNGRKFVSLEMMNGHIVYQYDLGEGHVTIQMEKTFNDGEWHTVEALRQNQRGVLKVDGSDTVIGEVSGNAKAFIPQERIYFGGHPTLHTYEPVTNEGFEGCIDQVIISDISVDLSSNLQAFGVMPGCPVRFANFVSFKEGRSGYVKLQNTTAPSSVQINFKFKTGASNGLMYYATNADKSAASSISLANGQIVVRSRGNEVSTSPINGVKYNDDEWYVVTVVEDDENLELQINDGDITTTEVTPPSSEIIYDSIFIGGLPQHYEIGPHEPASFATFIGCIGDATLNGVVINFANTTDRPGAVLGKCKGVDQSSKPSIIEVAPEPDTPSRNVGIEIAPAPTTNNELIDFQTDNDDGSDLSTLEGRYKVKPDEPDTSPHSMPNITSRVSSETDPAQTTPAPVTVDECRMPYYPADDPNSEHGNRFGTEKYSRLEYSYLQGRYKEGYDIQIDFKTMHEEGIIFYSANYNQQQDLIAVYLKDGKVHYQFNCGSGPALLVSERMFNDNQWHTVIFKRTGNSGELIVDEEPPVTGVSPGHTQTINVDPPFFVGGILPEISSTVFSTTGVNGSFNGCLRDLTMNAQLVGEPTNKIGVIPCSKRVEPGLFFYPGNGSNYYKAVDRFTVGRKINIQLNIKPRSSSGHLFSVHGKRDYLILEMYNGTVRFLVKTIKGTIETSYEPPAPNALCDGNWHKIVAVKQKNAVTLTVDQVTPPAGIGNKNTAAVLSRHPIFIGGHPKMKAIRGSISHQQYVGCINDVVINDNRVHFDPVRSNGRVLTGICPTI